MNAVSLLSCVNLSAHVITCLVVTAVSVLVAMNQTRVVHHVRTLMSVAMKRRVSMDVLTCQEDTAVNVPLALYNTSTGTNALVSISSNSVVSVVTL